VNLFKGQLRYKIHKANRSLHGTYNADTERQDLSANIAGRKYSYRARQGKLKPSSVWFHQTTTNYSIATHKLQYKFWRTKLFYEALSLSLWMKSLNVIIPLKVMSNTFV